MEQEKFTTQYLIDHPDEWLKGMNIITGGYSIFCLDCREMCLNELHWSKENCQIMVDAATTGRLNDFGFAHGSIGWVIHHHGHKLRVASIEEMLKEAQASKNETQM